MAMVLRYDLKGELKIHTEKLGTVREVVEFLQDFENAYNNIYAFQVLLNRDFAYKGRFSDKEYDNPAVNRIRKNMQYRNKIIHDYLLEEYLISNPYSYLARKSGVFSIPDVADLVLPDDRLSLKSITIQSPGWWDAIGNLNPLKSIVDVLNVVREWKKDARNHQLEEKRLQLEERRLIRENFSQSIANYREMINLLKDIGFNEEEIRQIVNNHLTLPMQDLASQMNKGMIGHLELKELDAG